MDVLILLLLLTPAFVSSAYEVQEEDITFYLYTRNQSEVQITLKNIHVIDTTKDLRFVIHGWNATHNATWVIQLTEAFLQAEDLNVILVDWTQVAVQSGDVAMANADQTGLFAANFIIQLVNDMGVDLENVEIVGQSLGAYIAGFIGKYVRKEFVERRVGKIVSLDPGNFLTENTESYNKDDADVFVVVHTIGGSLGITGGLGSVDFFANGGFISQPGCSTEDLECSHMIVTDFFIESIENPTGFLSTKCDSYANYVYGNCETNDQVALGANLKGREGNYFFQTNPEKPFSKN